MSARKHCNRMARHTPLRKSSTRSRDTLPEGRDSYDLGFYTEISTTDLAEGEVLSRIGYVIAAKVRRRRT
jgi:hypothetical protein